MKAISAERNTNTAMMTSIAVGVLVENAARRADDTMPEPYCIDDWSADADPPDVGSTDDSAAALAEAAIMPFIDTTKK